MLNSLFAERFKHIREKSGYTQAEMAEKLGVSRSALSLFEIGKRQPDLQVLKQFIEITECSPRYLLGLQDIEKDENTDICARTCLTANTVDELCDRNTAFERVKSDCEKFMSADIDERLRDYGDFVNYREAEQYLTSAVYENQIGNYIINAFLQDKQIISALSRAGYNATSAIVDHIYATSRINENLKLTMQTREINLNAALYVSGQAFANFFSDLCHDAELIANLYDLDEEDLLFAIENKILKYKDD